MSGCTSWQPRVFLNQEGVDLTGPFCTKWKERESTGRGSQVTGAGMDRNQGSAELVRYPELGPLRGWSLFPRVES